MTWPHTGTLTTSLSATWLTPSSGLWGAPCRARWRLGQSRPTTSARRTCRGRRTQTARCGVAPTRWHARIREAALGTLKTSGIQRWVRPAPVGGVVPVAPGPLSRGDRACRRVRWLIASGRSSGPAGLSTFVDAEPCRVELWGVGFSRPRFPARRSPPPRTVPFSDRLSPLDCGRRASAAGGGERDGLARARRRSDPRSPPGPGPKASATSVGTRIQSHRQRPGHDVSGDRGFEPRTRYLMPGRRRQTRAPPRL